MKKMLSFFFLVLLCSAFNIKAVTSAITRETILVNGKPLNKILAPEHTILVYTVIDKNDDGIELIINNNSIEIGTFKWRDDNITRTYTQELQKLKGNYSWNIAGNSRIQVGQEFKACNQAFKIGGNALFSAGHFIFDKCLLESPNVFSLIAKQTVTFNTTYVDAPCLHIMTPSNGMLSSIKCTFNRNVLDKDPLISGTLDFENNSTQGTFYWGGATTLELEFSSQQ